MCVCVCVVCSQFCVRTCMRTCTCLYLGMPVCAHVSRECAYMRMQTHMHMIMCVHTCPCGSALAYLCTLHPWCQSVGSTAWFPVALPCSSSPSSLPFLDPC